MDTQSSSRPPRFGCLGYGCLIATLLIVFTSLGIGFYLVRMVGGSIEFYTADHASPIIPTTPQPETVTSVDSKIAALANALRSGGQYALAFSPDEVAALPFSAFAPSALRTQLSLSSSGDTVSASFATRLGDLGTFGVASLIYQGLLERWAYGAATAQLPCRDGASSVEINALTLSGKPLEDVARRGASVWFTGALSAYVEQYPEVYSRLGCLQVKDGHVTVSIASANPTPTAQ